MGLSTDSIFIAALTADTSLMATIGSRLYGTAIPMPDEDADNTPVPYIIVTFDGLSNDAQTKDDPFEGDYDIVNIGVQIVAPTLASIHSLSQATRDAIYSYISGDDRGIDDYQFSATGIAYDSMKPCYHQILSYQCTTER